MIKLFFLPDKGNTVFAAPIKANTCIMDTAIVDLSGLVSFIEKRMGIYNETPSFNERLCHYYIAANSWFKAHPENVVSKSFDLSHLSTARQLLGWRDELKLAGWDFEYEDTKTRLGALAGIESERVVAGFADRLHLLLDAIATRKHTFVDIEIIVPVELKVLRPSIKKLLQTMKENGARVSVMRYVEDTSNSLGKIRKRLLDVADDKTEMNLTNDGSLRIMEFETTYHHDQYMAVSNVASNCDVWINPRSKETDNRLIAINQPTLGSSFTSRSRILEMLPLALSLYDNRLNIYKIVEWLTTPEHPLPKKFRHNLAQAIINTGGFTNETCLDIVKRYIDGEFEYKNGLEEESTEKEIQKRETEGRAKRNEKVATYIPYLNQDMSVVKAEVTLTRLAGWARQRIHTLKEDDGREALAIQLNALADGIDTLMMLFREQGITFDISLATEWVKDVPMDVQLPHCRAQVGAAYCVSNPSDIVAVASHILWSGMTYTDPQAFDCDFLLPGEVKALTSKAMIWSRQDESRYRYLLSIMPFLLASDKLELAYAVKNQGEVLIPHPIITRLKTLLKCFDIFVEHPNLSHLKTKPVVRVDNRACKTEHKFHYAKAIQLPSMISPTRLETFTMNPFDYLFENILHYESFGLKALATIDVTKGNVAHATIAQLLSPQDGEDRCTAAEARFRFEHQFETAFIDSINNCGAILMLPENKLELEQMHRQLIDCISALIEIIDENKLSVLGCESEASKFVDIHGKGGNTSDPDLHGRMDMTLIDEEGKQLVFDMKWTSSRHFYHKRIEENRSIQLAVYAELLATKDDADVKTGYFIMPRGRLISSSAFIGRNVDHIKKKNHDNIMEQLLNSFRYRCRQLMDGEVEEGEKYIMTELKYEQDRESMNLLPLEKDYEDETRKAMNRFSNYSLFKGN